MKMSDTIAEIAGAISRAQGMIDDASKSSANPFYKSKYADLAAVRSVIREPLAVCDLAILQAPRVVDGGAEVETIIMHKSGEFISETLFMPAGKIDPHGYASAITYARRIGLMSLLCLASYDDDGNTAVESVRSKVSDNLKAQALAEAKKGSESFRVFWKALPKADRDALTPFLESFKEASSVADSEVQQ